MKWEVGMRKWEGKEGGKVGRRNAEVGGQRTEDGRQWKDDRGQNSEVGMDTKSEVGMRKWEKKEGEKVRRWEGGIRKSERKSIGHRVKGETGVGCQVSGMGDKKVGSWKSK